MNKREDDDLNVRPDGVSWRVPQWFGDLGEESLRKLLVFQKELLKFNGRINLISPRTENNADQVHFADSILGGRLILSACDRSPIYDIGSGNGFPGLVMAVMAPERHFILVEKDGRKAEFLKHMAARMELDNVEIEQRRFEDLPAESIKCAVSRGFASLSRAVMTARVACAKGCEYFHFKGENWSTEIADMPSQLCAHWEPTLLGKYSLPERSSEVAIVLVKKLTD